MVRKIPLMLLVLCGALLWQMGARCLADERSLLGQADGHRSEKEYVQAEAIYKQIIGESNDVDYVLQAQKRLTIMYIESSNEVRAKQAFQELVAEFAGREDLPEVVFELAEEYRQEKKYDRAREVYQYLVDHWPEEGEAIDAQEAVVRSSILLEDDAAAEAATDSLIAKFSASEDLPKAVDHVADEYRSADKYEEARELYRYIVQRWPDAERAIESQRAVVLSSIRMGDDANAASELEKLISDFAENEKIAWAVCEVAEEYRESGRYDEALANYDYVVQTWPETEHAMEAQTYVAKLHISASDDANAQAAVENLVTGYAKEGKLVEALEELAKEYGKASKHDKASELYGRIAEMWPDRDEAIWAQVAAVTSRIRAWDLDGAEGELGTLLVEFAANDRLGEAVHEIVEEYRNAGAHEESRELFNYLLEEWSASGETMLELQVGVALQSIRLNQLDKADAAVQKLIADYNDNAKLAKGLFQVAEEYYMEGFRQENQDLVPESKDYFAKALTLWEKIITDIPQSEYAAEALLHSGDCCCRLGKYQTGITYYQKLVDDWPGCKYAWHAQFLVAHTCQDLMNQDLMPAETATNLITAAYQRILRDYPDSAGAYDAQMWFQNHENLSKGEEK